MHVFARALVLGFLVTVCVPTGAAAETITLTSSTDGCALVADPSLCSSYDLAPSSDGTVEGSLTSADALALFAFSFTDSTLFTVTTSSWGEGGFDPTLALFDSTGQILLLSDPLDPSASIAARFFDIDIFGNFDDHIELTLAAGSYFLALINGSASYTFNGENGSESLALGYGGCLECGFDGRESVFSFVTSASPVDGEPVPEPGTLSLMAGGAVAGLLRRRHRRKGQDRSAVL